MEPDQKPEETEGALEEASKPDAPMEPVTVTLVAPVTWGKGKDAKPIESITLRPCPRLFREVKFAVDPQSGKMDVEPYALAQAALRFAGHPAAVLDKLDHRDMFALSSVMLSFFG